MDIIDLILIVILCAALYLVGGIIYLIYLPFKRKLIRSGKLSIKTSRRINIAYVLLLIVLAIIAFQFRHYRTPSNERIETVADIKLPEHFTVLHDEYKDMDQDYCVYYTIRFDKKSSRELTHGIRKSRFYNAIISPDSLPNGNHTIWCKSLNGYRFHKKKGLVFYTVEVDTVSKLLNYEECAD